MGETGLSSCKSQRTFASVFCMIFSIGGESSNSIHRLTPQQYSSGQGQPSSRSGCGRVKTTSAERSLEVAAARKQVNQLNSIWGATPKFLGGPNPSPPPLISPPIYLSYPFPLPSPPLHHSL